MMTTTAKLLELYDKATISTGGSDTQAVKIVNEHRAQMIASGEWS